jgi:FKBP-type peptidyl-prolyl cis-trans isomerase (trigger factor)
MPSVPGTELDRVVALVNGDLILDSDVNEEQRFAAFQPYQPSDIDDSRSRAIERLINRDLILQQIKLQPEDQIADADVTKQIDELRRTIPACQRYQCETKDGWDRFLADHGFTQQTLFTQWKQRMEVLQFIEERFSTGLDVTPAQVQQYYTKTMLPEYTRQHATPPKLATISSQIREVLLQQQISNLLSDWLKSLRAQGSIVTLHPGEEAP